MRLRGSRETREAVIGAVAIAVIGFGVMTTLAVVTDNPPGLRDFWSYRSATVGDALLLPTLVFAFLKLAPLRTRLTVRRIFLVGGGGVVGVSSGAALILNALVTPHSDLNWTQPRPHYFNAPGWYHATFLIIMSGLLAAMFVAAVTGTNRRTESIDNAGDTGKSLPLPYTRSRLYLDLITIAAVGFACLLARDNFPTGEKFQPAHAALPAAAIALVVGVRMLVAATGKRSSSLREAAAPVTAGCALGALMWNGFASASGDQAIVVLGAVTTATASVLAVAYYQRAPKGAPKVLARMARDWVTVCLVVAGPLIMVLDSGTLDQTKWAAGVLAAVVGSRLVLEGVLRRERSNDNWPSNRIANLSVLFILVSWAAMWWRGSRVAAEAAVPQFTLALLALAASTLIPKILRQLISVVESGENHREDAAALNLAKARAYVTLGALLVMGFAMLGEVTLAGTADAPTGGAAKAGSMGWWCIVIVFLGASSTWFLRNWHRAELFATIVLAIDLCAFVWLAVSVQLRPWTPAEWYALWPALIVGLFIAISLYDQGNRLTRDARRPSLRLATILGAALAFVGVAIFPAVTSLPHGLGAASLTQGVLIWVGGVVLAPLAAVAAHSTAHRRRTAVERGAIGFSGPTQDVLLAFLMAVLALALPLLLIATVAAGVALTVAGVVLVWGGWGGWLPLTFNKKYLDYRVEEYHNTGTTYPPDLIALEKHMQWQNLVAGVLLAPLLLFGLLEIWWTNDRLLTVKQVRAKLTQATPRVRPAVAAEFAQVP